MPVSFTTGCTMLLSLLTASSGFNTNTVRPRRMPPLFYTDIEPEIRSITIPSEEFFNETTIAFQATEFVAKSIMTTKEKNKTVPLRKGNKRTQNENSSASTKTSSHNDKKTHDLVWNQHYANLLKYKENHGDCLVPQNYPENRKLGLWVMQQRRQYSLMKQGKNSSLTGKRGEYRLQLLEDIGFVWLLDRRGPRKSYALMRNANALTEHEMHNIVNFERYMIEKADQTDDQIRDAWMKRFEVLR